MWWNLHTLKTMEAQNITVFINSVDRAKNRFQTYSTTYLPIQNDQRGAREAK